MLIYLCDLKFDGTPPFFAKMGGNKNMGNIEKNLVSAMTDYIEDQGIKALMELVLEAINKTQAESKYR